jgi:hypothetical protein
VRRNLQELVPKADRFLRLAVEPGVVDGDGGAVRHRLHQL